MASVMPDLQLPSQHRALLPCHQYQIILLGDRVWLCVNNLLKVVT